MTTAVIGTGVLGSAIVRLLAGGGEDLRISSPDSQSVRRLIAELKRPVIAGADNRDAVREADAVILAVRFSVLKGVIEEIAALLADKLVVVPSNPLGTDAQGKVNRLLPEGQHSGQVVAGWLPANSRLAMTFGTMSADLLQDSSSRFPDLAALFYVTDDDRAAEDIEALIRTAGFAPAKVGGIDQSDRLEVGGDLHDVVVSLPQARGLIAGAASGSANV
jgi:hypothetical protein